DYDKKDDWDADVDAAWDTACEAAEGEIFVIVGSGEEVFADEIESMFCGAAEYTAATKPGLDINLDPDGLATPEAPAAPLKSSSVSYAPRALPLVPVFNSALVLRTLPLTDSMSLSLQNLRRRLRLDRYALIDL